ncbi:MAG: metal-sulfur cluster assembly factor [Pirellulales bacterium]
MSEENSSPIPQLPLASENTCQSAADTSGDSHDHQSGGCCGGNHACSSKATETVPQTLSEESVREQLKQVIDPELFVNIVDLGLVYTVELTPHEEDNAKQNVQVEMTLTSPMCPAGPQLVAGSRQVIEALPGVGEVDIKVVMDPPWSPDRMTEDARDQLNIF